jgi:hypothetical protein
VFKKIFLKAFGLLRKVCTQDNNWYDQEYNSTKLNGARDLIRVFKSTTLLNDMEMVLAGFDEREIMENKEVDESKEVYEQILEHFRLIMAVKKKVVESVEEIYIRLTEDWSGLTHIREEIKKLIP